MANETESEIKTIVGNLPETIRTQMDQFSGRIWLWLLIQRWFAEGPEQIFLLTGGPGTGKSMIMGWLATAGVDVVVNPLRREIYERITAVHFCRANDRSSITPLAFADRVANQLVQHVVGFDEALIQTLEPYGVKIEVEQTSDYVEAGATVTGVEIEQLYLAGLTAADPFDISFIQPLQKLYQNGYDQPMLILVDALDEAWSGQEQGQNLVRALAQLDGLPKQVKLLITTRPDPRVTMFFEGARQFDLVADALEATDINDFAEDWLLGQHWGQEGAKRVAKQIDKAAKGIFLYAHMVLRDVMPTWKDAEDADKALDLPEGLSGLYNNFFNREVGADRKRWHQKLKPLLGMIAVAQGAGVELEKLELLLGWEPSYELEICQQYLTGPFPDGPFHLFHQSLAEFLLEERDKNKYYRIKAKEMHQRFTNPYQLDNNWNKLDAYDQWHLPFHARNAGVLEALAAKPEFWIDCKPAAVRDSLEMYSNLSEGSQVVAAIFAFAYPDLLSEEPMMRAAILHASAIRQASQMAATFFEPVLERSPWRTLWAYTRSLVIPYRNRKTVGRVKALTGAVVNDRLYVVTLERTNDQFKQQLSVWAPVEDTVRTTTITVPINVTPKLRVINAGTESYIEIRDSGAGAASVILVTFEGLDQIFTGWNFAIAVWKVDNSIYSIEVDSDGAVYLQQLSSPPFYLHEENILKRSPETIHETPIAQLDSRPNWLLPIAIESTEPALVAVDIQDQLTILFPQSAHQRTIFTKLSQVGGLSNLKR